MLTHIKQTYGSTQTKHDTDSLYICYTTLMHENDPSYSSTACTATINKYTQIDKYFWRFYTISKDFHIVYICSLLLHSDTGWF